jgi:phosphohistidine phosphatase SixA
MFALGAASMACAVATAPAPGAAVPDSSSKSDEARRVYVVRHAEKEQGDGDDPGLTPAGQARAAALVAELPVEDVVAIYSTDFLRTQATVRPLATATGVKITSYDPADNAGLVASIHALGPGVVVVAGHSNTVPGILAVLGVNEMVSIEDDQYGDLYVVILGARDSGADARLTVGHYGNK